MSQIIPESNPASPPPAIPDSKTSLKSTYPEQLWKLVKGKTVLQYHLCQGYKNLFKFYKIIKFRLSKPSFSFI